ncbi:hypothetical protein [Kitasatospora sp. NPDC093679]|uniref:hypothetical protein n=1 Tax=Kitasatospora sp. NPDC093679 TaxID=3154983 RepID=UPI00341714CA
MDLSFGLRPEPYDLGPDPDLATWLAELGATRHRVVHLGPDDGRSHGQLCWDVLEPTGLLAVHCRDCRHGHGGPRDPARMDAALKIGIPPGEIVPWTAATLLRDLVYRTGEGGLRPVAEAVARGLVDLLGPGADWRANGYAAYREGATGNVHWAPVSEATFDAAVVGIGNGHAVVVVATGED